MKRLLAPIFLSAAAACTGTVGDAVADHTDGDNGARDPQRGAAGQTLPAAGARPGPEEPTTPVTAEACARYPVSVGKTPLRRLSRVQYANTTRDLLGTTLGAVIHLTEDADEQVTKDGFVANTAAVDENRVRDYYEAAVVLAKEAVDGKLKEWLPCDWNQSACARTFLVTFGRRALRRPLAGEEVEAYAGLYERERARTGGAGGLEAVLAALLMSPSFIYRLDFAAAARAGAAAPLDDHSLAARLSYFLWDSMPDAAGFAAADGGLLRTPQGLEREARRMLADAKAQPVIRQFHDLWLGIAGIEELPAGNPIWTADMARSAHAETMLFVQDLFTKGDGRLSTLLTAKYSFLDKRLAGLYGLAGAPPAGMARLDLGSSARLGVLTHASVLASHASTPEVHRGLLVRARLMCEHLPDPPSDAADMQGANRLETAPCNGCHNFLDRVGLAFQVFSRIGQYRATDEKGAALDDLADVRELTAASDMTGQYRGVAALATRLARSMQVAGCMAQTWLSYAIARPLAGADQCSAESLFRRFAASGFDLRELLVAITVSDAFRYVSSSG